MSPTVTENTKLRRFELPIADGVIAAAYYKLDNGRVVLVHTEVPSGLSGQGYASQLARGTFELLRSTGRRAVSSCPFMSRFLLKHPEYADVIG